MCRGGGHQYGRHTECGCYYQTASLSGYTLERAVEITRGSIERLGAARLYVLIDGGPSPEDSNGWPAR